MAKLAGVWEACRNVIGIVRTLILRGVAAIAIGRNTRVVIVHVALCARDRGVCTRQRETGVVVVEGRWCPAGSAVAHVALLRKIACDVRWIVRLLVVGEVAGNAGSIRQVVGGRTVTLAALQGGMGARQWPSRAGVIERRRRPVGGRVAQLALLWEARGHVIRAIRAGVFRAVASVTVGCDRSVVIVLMAVRAGHGRMLPRQRKARVVVVEGRRGPGGRAVTHLALLRKIR